MAAKEVADRNGVSINPDVESITAMITTQTRVQEHLITCITWDFQDGRWVIPFLSGPEGTWGYHDVVALIDSGWHKFFATDGIKKVEILVFPGGRYGRFLQTASDDRQSNNLERLPHCR